MVKLINGLTKLILHTLLVAGLTIFLTWTAVHTYLDKILSQYHLETGQSKVQFSDFLAQLSSSMNILKPTRSQKSASDPSAIVDQASSSATSETIENNGSADGTNAGTDGVAANKGAVGDPVGAANDGSTSSNGTPNKGTQPIAESSSVLPTTIPDKQPTASANGSDNSVPVFKQNSDANAQSDQTKKQTSILMTAEQFSQKKDQISENDKLKIFSLLSTALPQADLQQFSTYLESGVTEEEWVNIQKEVQKYLKPADYKQLLDILAKYQG